jgi:hypothetical protein
LKKPRLKIFERTIDVGHLATSDLFSGGTLFLIGALCPSSPRMHDD